MEFNVGVLWSNGAFQFVCTLLLAIALGLDQFVYLNMNDGTTTSTDTFGVYTADLDSTLSGTGSGGSVGVDCTKGISALWRTDSDVSNNCESQCNAKKWMFALAMTGFACVSILTLVNTYFRMAEVGKKNMRLFESCAFIVATICVWAGAFLFFVEMGREYDLLTGAGATYNGEIGTCRYKLGVGDGATITQVDNPKSGTSLILTWVVVAVSGVLVLTNMWTMWQTYDGEI
jgi:hypothetical protein